MINEHLGNLVTHSRRVTADAQALFAALSDEQFLWKPAADVWGVAECIAHIEKANSEYFPRIRSTLDKTQHHQVRETQAFKPRLLQRKFIESIAPPVKRRVRTFKVFVPLRANVAPSTKQRFIDQNNEIVGLIEQADGWDLNKHKLASPVTPLLRFSIGEALWLLVVHAQRHLLQARHVTEMPGFPSS